MNVQKRHSLWFYVGAIIVACTWGTFAFNFLAVLTWGMIGLPILMLIWFGPWFLLHYLPWGRNYSEQLAPVSASADGEGLSRPLHHSCPTWPKALRMVGTAIVVVCILAYYLLLWGLWRPGSTYE